MRKSMMKFWSFLLRIIAESVVWKLQDLPPICQWFCWVKVVKLEGGAWLSQFVGSQSGEAVGDVCVVIHGIFLHVLSLKWWAGVDRQANSCSIALEIWIFVPSHSSLAQHWDKPVSFFDAGGFVIPLLFTSRKCVIFSLLFKVRRYSTLTRHSIRLV